MYGRKKKILVRSSGGSFSLIFEHSNDNLTSDLTTPSLSLIEPNFIPVSPFLYFSQRFTWKENFKLKYRQAPIFFCTADKKNRTGKLLDQTRGRSDWLGRNVSARYLHDDPFSSLFVTPQFIIGKLLLDQTRLGRLD